MVTEIIYNNENRKIQLNIKEKPLYSSVVKNKETPVNEKPTITENEPLYMSPEKERSLTPKQHLTTNQQKILHLKQEMDEHQRILTSHPKTTPGLIKNSQYTSEAANKLVMAEDHIMKDSPDSPDSSDPFLHLRDLIIDE